MYILLSRVRQSVLEALAALAPFLPPAQLRLDPQDFSPSDADDTRLFSDALQTRLMRKVLPSVSPEGLILYSLYIPNNPGTCTLSSVSVLYLPYKNCMLFLNKYTFHRTCGLTKFDLSY